MNTQWEAALVLTLAHCRQITEAANQAELLKRRASGGAAIELQVARCLAVCSQRSSAPDLKRQYVDRAVAAVEAASQNDFDDPALLANDLELAILKTEPAFQSLVEALRNRLDNR